MSVAFYNAFAGAESPKASYTPVSNQAGSRSSITRSPAQKPAHKDLSPKWLRPSHLARGHLCSGF
ncbi:hypothetical protein BVJ53_07840 [Lacticaseibacillus chiayiensis]|uniref:Alpha-galactosidase n=1 Tax=Lacticaseibacillus chiayiensis TaxID=2100821 RepID=A0A4Q1TXC8_9LACO|nr:hypothetical protein BVJ53_07840 [Lacticaseibacillus chiayiensis]